MAVTNYKETNNYPQTGGRGSKVKDGFGNGTPIGDTALADDTNYPIGSRYLDLDDGAIYSKTSAGTWTNSSTVV